MTTSQVVLPIQLNKMSRRVSVSYQSELLRVKSAVASKSRGLRRYEVGAKVCRVERSSDDLLHLASM